MARTLPDMELTAEDAGVATALLSMTVERPTMMPPLEISKVDTEAVKLAVDSVAGTGETVMIVGWVVTE